MNDGTLILRLQGTEVTINSTANTISGGSFVRVLNKDGGYVTLTHQRVAANLANVSITLAPGQDVLLNKAPSDTLTSNSGTNCVGVAVKRF